jgi:CRISPR-associated protein Cas1
MKNDRLLPLRMLNEFTYCPRLFHLEWVQSEWADNVYTLDGKRVHKHVDKPRQRRPKEGECHACSVVSTSPTKYWG